MLLDKVLVSLGGIVSPTCCNLDLNTCKRHTYSQMHDQSSLRRNTMNCVGLRPDWRATDGNGGEANSHRASVDQPATCFIITQFGSAHMLRRARLAAVRACQLPSAPACFCCLFPRRTEAFPFRDECRLWQVTRPSYAWWLNTRALPPPPPPRAASTRPPRTLVYQWPGQVQAALTDQS